MIRFILSLVFRGQNAEPEAAYPCSTINGPYDFD